MQMSKLDVQTSKLEVIFNFFSKIKLDVKMSKLDVQIYYSQTYTPHNVIPVTVNMILNHPNSQ